VPKRDEVTREWRKLHNEELNPLTPNDHYSGRTAPLTSRCSILNIYSTNIRTEYFIHTALSQFFSLQNAVYFIMLPFLVPVLFTF
jgi:thiosulfate reductase cytochrome b subunit